MNELTSAAVLKSFFETAQQGVGQSLEGALRRTGWTEVPPGTRGLGRQWEKGEVVARQYGGGLNAFVEVTIEIREPDSPDGDEEPYMEDFEERFNRSLAQAVSLLGQASFAGEYGDDGFLEDADAVKLAYWSVNDRTAALNFKHEDQGVPFRITVTLH